MVSPPVSGHLTMCRMDISAGSGRNGNRAEERDDGRRIGRLRPEEAQPAPELAATATHIFFLKT